MIAYIDNKEFYELLCEYKRTNKRSTLEKIGRNFLKIAENIIKMPNFINYSPDRKNDMISDATFYMTKYINTYDLERKNPFAYFSQVAINAFTQNINKHNRAKEFFVPLTYIENMTKKENSDLYD